MPFVTPLWCNAHMPWVNRVHGYMSGLPAGCRLCFRDNMEPGFGGLGANMVPSLFSAVG